MRQMVFVGKSINFRTGRPNCRIGRAPALAACAHGHFHPELIETQPYPFDDAPAAWLTAGLRSIASRTRA